MTKQLYRKLKEQWLWLFNILFFVVVYGIMFVRHYSVDSYAVGYDMRELIQSTLSAGRLVFFLWGVFLNTINLNLVVHQWLGVLCLLTAIVCSHTLLYRTFAGILGDRGGRTAQILLWCAVSITFCNPFIAEWFFYIEMAVVFATVILSWGLSIYFLAQDTTKGWLLATFWALVGVNSYQASICCFLIWGVLYFLVRDGLALTRRSFSHIAGVVLLSAGASVVAMLFGKLLPYLSGYKRRFTEFSLEKNILYLWEKQASLWQKGLGLMPAFSCAVFAAVCLLVVVACFFRAGKKGELAWSALVLTGCYAAVFLPHYINSSQWLVPRSVVAFFCFCSALLVVGLFAGAGMPRLLRLLRLLTAVACAFLVICSVQIVRMTWQQIQTNRKDAEEVFQLEQAIEAYQEKTGIQVKKISWNADKALVYIYPETTVSSGEISQRVLTVPWEIEKVLWFYTGMRLSPIEADETVRSYFAEQNWSELNLEEQLIFDGDTVHFCCY